MLYEIKHWDGRVLVTQEADSLKSAIELLVKGDADLSGADLSGADLRDADLRDADLRDADLSGAVLSDAVLRDADLSGAVLSGAVLSDADLRDADLRDADLRDADLSGADLRGADLSGAVLSDAVLRDADLSGAVLSGAVLSDADLSGADLRDADLRDADLRDADLSGAEYYKVPDLHQKMLAAIEAGGSLDMSTWHACETTHCRAGWAVHLAGNAGRLLESVHGSAMAGALIHQASCPWMEKVPDFYASNEAALADIKACAEREKVEASK